MEKYTLIGTGFLSWADKYFSEDIRLFNNELDVTYIIDEYSQFFNTTISIPNFLKKLEAWCKLRGYQLENTRQNQKFIIVWKKDLKDYCKGCYYVEKSEDLDYETDRLINDLTEIKKQRNIWRALALFDSVFFIVIIIIDAFVI